MVVPLLVQDLVRIIYGPISSNEWDEWYFRDGEGMLALKNNAINNNISCWN